MIVDITAISDGCLFSDPKIAWLQFTGLLDKNGKEIYEGDIVHKKAPGEDYRFVVEWNDSNCGFNLLRSFHKYYEVIGNIHETPESF